MQIGCEIRFGIECRTKNGKKTELDDLINHFGSYWNEWRYAWDRAADLGFTLQR